MQLIGSLDKNKLGKYKDIILSDKVILTRERKEHIERRHPGVFEKYGKYISDILKNPDYILEDSDYNDTLLILKNIIENDVSVEIVVRLHTNKEEKNKCNSILAFWQIKKRSCVSTINNNELIYSKFDKNE